MMAALIFPSAVLTHRKVGVRAAAEPEPVLTTWCAHPASATAPKQARPSLTTSHAGSRLRLAKVESAVAEVGGDTTQFQAHRFAFGRGLDGGHERRLARRTATALATGT